MHKMTIHTRQQTVNQQMCSQLEINTFLRISIAWLMYSKYSSLDFPRKDVADLWRPVNRVARDVWNINDRNNNNNN